MTDSVSDVSTSRTTRIAPVWLILICVAALALFLLLLRSWQLPMDASNVTVDASMQRSLLLPFAGFALALGAGICLGLWWPSRAERPVESADAEAPAPVINDVSNDLTIPLPRHSALVEEEHIVGGHQLHVKTDASDPTADFDGTLETVEMQLPVEMKPEVATAEPPRASVERGHDAVDPELATDNRDEERRAFESTLAAKDQLIESLEDIVKENRDRWGGFEVQRDELLAKIEKLEAEARIANFIIEGARGTSDDKTLEPPQVLTRA